MTSSPNAVTKYTDHVVEVSEVQEIKWYTFGRRHSQTLLMFLGLVVSYCLRTNLSVAIVAMTNTNDTKFPTMDWGSEEKSLVLSSFFWGYFALNLPAGILAKNYGPTILLAITFFLQSILAALTPVAAIYGGHIALVINRVILGLCQAFVYPCVNTHMGKWAVPQERNKLFSFAFGGAQVGAMVILWSGGYLAANQTLGWPSIFYVSAGFCLLWSLACFFFGADCPNKHKTISQAEKNYINAGLTYNQSNCKNMKIPWKKIFRSVPLMALLCAHCGNNWGFMVLLTLIPSYIGHALNFTISDDGFLSALPYLAMWIFGMCSSLLADWLLRKEYISTTFSRKMWNSIAHYGGAVALIILAFVPTNYTGAIVLLVIAVGINSASFMGYLCNHLDLSPNFAGPLMGFTNSVANFVSILGPLISTSILKDETDKSEWTIVFVVSAIIFIVGNTVFLIFGSTEVQPWNEAEECDSRGKV